MSMGETLVGFGLVAVAVIAVLIGVYWPKRELGERDDGGGGDNTAGPYI